MDDYLPVIKNTTVLRFSKPNKEEIWLPLLEKAYAKTHGGYGSLITCDTSSVIQCFTGLPVEKMNIFDIDDKDLKMILKNNLENYIFLLPNIENYKDIGVVPGKAYQLKEILNISLNNNENEENKENYNLVLKIYNEFEYNKYKDNWSEGDKLFTDEIKTKYNFNSEDKKHMLKHMEVMVL